MMLYFYAKRIIFLPRTIASHLIVWRDWLFFRRAGRQLYVSPVSYQAALLFPIHLAQAFIQSAELCLSCVRVPVQWCDGRVQRSYAVRRRGKKFRPRSKLMLFGLLSLMSLDTARAIPGSGYGLIKESTNDPNLQARQVKKAIQAISRRSTIQSRTKERTIKQCEPPCCNQRPDGDAAPERDKQPRVFVADTDSIEFILDTGTNGYIVNDYRLLKNYQPSRGSIKGVNGKPTIYSGTGDLELTLRFDCNHEVTVNVKGIHVPHCPYNLMPPQILVGELKKQGMGAECKYDDKAHSLLLKDPETNETKTLTSLSKSNKLFSVRVNQGYKSFFCHAVGTDPQWCSFAGALHVIPSDDSDATIQSDEANQGGENDGVSEGNGKTREPTPSGPNLIEDESDSDEGEQLAKQPRSIDFLQEGATLEKEDISVVVKRRKQARLATIHEKLGHLSFYKLQNLARAGLIPRDLANVPIPTCPGCAYGKAHRKPIRTKGQRKQLRKATRPGEVVSVDQLVSPTAGFIPTHRGIPTTARYIGATVFVDHFSDFTYIHLMTKLDAESTVEAKNAFERIAQGHGVSVSHYHSDNGLFDTKAFKESVQTARQTLSFCGPNAHHQNGKAENRIKDVTTHARTALLHAAHRWPEAVNAHLWPAALKHYCNVRNAMPVEFVRGRQVGKRKEADQMHSSPLSKFSGTEVQPNLNHFHPFGCPVYVLESKLQAQHSHNKWEDRSKVGIFLCHSPSHATSVPLVLNTQTGNVAPQFHCIYDDDFSTCKRDAKFRSLWQHKAKFSAKPMPDTVDRVVVPATQPVPAVTSPAIETPTETATDDAIPPSRLTEQIVEPTRNEEPRQADFEAADEQVPLAQQLDRLVPQPPVAEPNDAPVRTTRVGRTVKKIQKMNLLASFFSANTPHILHAREFPHQLLQPDIEAQSEPHPFAMLSAFVGSADPDTMTLDEALREPDRDEFLKAMEKELADHIGRKHWKVVPLRAIPKHKRPIPMVWSMKRKRDPLGNITKWKARLCAGGHKSVEFVDYWSTYSPVVTWSTVRLMITMALINNWHIRSIDFVLAFPQAPVKTDIFMSPPKVPRDFEIPDLPHPNDRRTKCYQLIKNLYGLKDAGKTWFDFLSQGLKERGWKPSSVDTCLFTKPGILLMVYVDDAILISADEGLIDREIKSLQESYSLTDDGALKDYLGTRFDRKADGSVEMTQPKMIERALDIVGLNKDGAVKMHDTPASESKILDRDPDGECRKQEWNYRSAVGCLSYIQAMIRPDITMAVQQCARFCNDPKREHEEAVKRICRYLLRTKDKGLVFKPDLKRGLECYVDADWAGSWQKRSADDPLSAHSRTGFVIMYAGCPIVWASKMQTLIALSTTEAEYIALSTALREVIGIMNLVNELQERGFDLNAGKPKVVCKTFEDNRSCIEIATNHKTRPRTKHLSVRLHHFRSKVVDGSISIEHISTKDQIADIFTKPLGRAQFIKLRDLLMSWSTS